MAGKRRPAGAARGYVPAAPGYRNPDHVLTYRQAQILRAIRESISTRGIPPSMREIGDAVGLASANSVSYQIRQLRKYGYLVQVPPMGSSRRPAS